MDIKGLYSSSQLWSISANLYFCLLTRFYTIIVLILQFVVNKDIDRNVNRDVDEDMD